MDNYKGVIPKRVKFKSDDILHVIEEENWPDHEKAQPDEQMSEQGALEANVTPSSRSKKDEDNLSFESSSLGESSNESATIPSPRVTATECWNCIRCKYKNADLKGLICARCGMNRLIRKQPRQKTSRGLVDTKLQGEKSLSAQAENALEALLCDSSGESDAGSSVELPLNPPFHQPLRKHSGSPASIDGGAGKLATRLGRIQQGQKLPDYFAHHALHHTLNVTDLDDMVPPEPVMEEEVPFISRHQHSKRQYVCGCIASRLVLILVTIFVCLCVAVVVTAILLLANNNSNDNGSSPTPSPSLPGFPTPVPLVSPTVAPMNSTPRPTEPENQNVLPGFQPIRGPPRSGFGKSISLNGNGTVVAVGAYNARNANGVRGGVVQVFALSPDNYRWTQLGQDLVGENPVDKFGTAVSLSLDGVTAAVGGPGYDDGAQRNTGYVEVYRIDREDNEWIRLGSSMHGKSKDEKFGSTITQSENGETLAVGSRNAVKVYTFDAESRDWIQLGSEILEGGRDDLGWMVALSNEGRTLAIGVPQDKDLHPAVVRLYEFDDEVKDWSMRGQINGTSIAGSTSDFEQVPSVSISGDGNTVAVHEIQSAGFSLAGVFAFSREHSSWGPLGQSIAVNVERFIHPKQSSLAVAPQSVSLSGDGRVLAVNVAGVPFIFWYDSVVDRWQKVINDFIFFGNAVQLSGDGKFVAVGNEVSSQVDFFRVG